MVKTASQTTAMKKKLAAEKAKATAEKVKATSSAATAVNKAAAPASDKNKPNKKRKLDDDDDDEDEYLEESEDSDDYDTRELDLKKREKLLNNKEKALQKKEENLKSGSTGKRGRKKTEEEEKVDVISIQYKIADGRPNVELNGTFATAVIDELIGFDQDFTKEDVSISFLLMDPNTIL